jgi:hypothetical protein
MRSVHPYLLLAVDLFHWLPGWGAAAVLLSLAIGLWALGRFLAFRFQSNINAAIRHCCEPLRDALVDVHSVESAEKPARQMAGACDGDTAESDSDLGSLDFADDVDWFWVEATITPRDRTASWEPRQLEMVASEFNPTEDFEVCEEAAALHTVEVWRNRKFAPQREKTVTGPQRLRMLFATPSYVHDAKFACHYTCFGRIELPRPVAACS